ncbi:hypothetical protein FRC09_017049 [Ceratobasidium sp. 395]|nr:hypothetical protein FRC09_017049 [Ceratobasidium sp. 395]
MSEFLDHEAVANVFKRYATLTVEKAQTEAGVNVPGPETIPPIGASGRNVAHEQQHLAGPSPATAEPTPLIRVAIVGAGCAGLYAAMMLQSIGVEVDVLEANKRIGGRLYTHKFEGDYEASKWDYFDVGAMRFPNTPLMRKTFDLFNLLRIPHQAYTISDGKNFMLYNNIRKRKSDLENASIWRDDPFKVFGSLPHPWVEESPSDLLYEAIKPWIIRLKDAHAIEDPTQQDLEFQRIFQEVDSYSTRSYLSIIKGYPQTIINWIECMTFGTGWFNRSFIETVMEELAFQYDKPSPTDLQWYCVEGGSGKIIRNMKAWLDLNTPSVNIKRDHQVTTVKLNEAEPYSDEIIKRHPYFTISCLQPSQLPATPLPSENTYSHVIFAIPPPCIRMIDISTCELDFAQRQALRELELAPSSKVGMKFKTHWWKNPNVDITRGGQSTTDRFARTIVYPSQGNFVSTALIVSYCWTQDSLVMGALMQGKGSPAYERLKQILLEDLAHVHNVRLEDIANEFEDMYPFDWNHNPYSAGAFGLFGPGQFSKVYSSFARPAARGQMHFVGETFSTTHGWVAGALESSERGVMQMLQLIQGRQPPIPPPPTSGRGPQQGPSEDVDLIQKFKDDWKPHLLVDEEHTKAQVVLSLKLQAEEFELR